MGSGDQLRDQYYILPLSLPRTNRQLSEKDLQNLSSHHSLYVVAMQLSAQKSVRNILYEISQTLSSAIVSFLYISSRNPDNMYKK